MSANGLYTAPKLAAYRRGEGSLPDRYWLWPLYGAGLENLGANDRPIQVDMPICGPDQLLVRHDAVGLCFSDTKVIKAGEEHPRLAGRDMKAHPVVLGHEVILTVIQVGDNYRKRFHPGERYLVQADIYYKGVGLAYGYALQGGLSQYNTVGIEVLDGDDGCYLLPVKEETGYAQAALTEPWACVLASYIVNYRVGWKPGGVALIVAGPKAKEAYTLGTPYAGGQPPAKAIAMGLQGALLEELRQRSKSDGFGLIEIAAVGENALAQAVVASGQDGFDDLVLLGADTATFELVQPQARTGAVINLVGSQGFEDKAQVDAGRIHYDGLSLIGTTSSDLSQAYRPIRTELLPHGCAAFLGAAGPMGQMHVQRALQAENGPRLVVGTDLVKERLDVLETKFGELIKSIAAKTTVSLRVPGDQAPEAFNQGLVEATGGLGFDDMVVLAPSPRVVAGAVEMMAPNGVLNIFAGLPRGAMAPINLKVIVDRGIRFTGTSGSSISDLRLMLDAAESQTLDPNLSVVAVSGFKGVKEGLEGVVHQAFPGKVVIYPQILDLPLTRLEDMESALPGVYAKLGPNHAWTIEAEEELFKELLP